MNDAPMNGDIVTRLRTTLAHADDVYDTMNEAADEIERLRELVEHLSSQLRLQLKANDKAWQAYKEVVGDE